MNLALAPYLSVTGVCYVFLHCGQKEVQEYVYCFLIKCCAINCDGLKTAQHKVLCVCCNLSVAVMFIYSWTYLTESL
jgi:hypothetical protein